MTLPAADVAISPPSPGPEITSSTTATRRRLGPLDVLALSAWCGLAGGLLEVGARVVAKSLPSFRFYAMSRHFIWMAPLSSLLLFSGMGVFLVWATRSWPSRGGWLAARLIVCLAILPVLLAIAPGIEPWSSAILAAGISSCLSPLIERRPAAARRWLSRSFPALLGVVLVLATLVIGGDQLKQWREAGRPLPPGDPPNVLLIVMDTVRADHLSLYGYRRPTTPALERLAQRAVRFDEARATAPWTLPSHASMFTGRWPHELGTDWNSPPATFPTLAEYLGSRGYATAGFVANILYCSYEFGLDRGITYHEDYVLGPATPLRMCWLGDVTSKAVAGLGRALSSMPVTGLILPERHSPFWRPLAGDPEKKSADTINRDFLAWLSRRREPGRPFFAFLNYYDAHDTYVPPPGERYRFGMQPRHDADFQVLVDWVEIDKSTLTPYYKELAQDCYDTCIGYLDERLGELFDELKRRGILDRTLVIVTSDHGEGLGEHGLYYHGETLYRHEIRVPLLIARPGEDRPVVVSETVSLRDLPATIADLTGQADGAPFPGRSLARLWRDPRPRPPSPDAGGAISELASPNSRNPNQRRSPIHRGPLVSLAEGDYVYIRNEGDGSEELFNEREDPHEFDNRARFEGDRAIKERLRAHLDRMRAGHRVATE